MESLTGQPDLPKPQCPKSFNILEDIFSYFSYLNISPEILGTNARKQQKMRTFKERESLQLEDVWVAH